MAIYKTRTRVPANRCLVLNLPEDVLPGEVEVTVAPVEPRQPVVGAPAAELVAHCAERERLGWRGAGRSAAEVEAAINAERDSWD